MKRLLAIGFILVSVQLVRGQEEEFATVYDPIPPIVYQAPVLYQASVVYQAPVIYQAAVYYVNTAPECAPVVAEPCAIPSRPNVIFIGRGEPYGVDFSQCASSPVIYFGRMQAQRHGYQFTKPR